MDDGSGDVSVEEFCALISKLGISASMADAAGLFRRFGYDSVMPFQRWAAQLINQPSRQLADECAGGRCCAEARGLAGSPSAPHAAHLAQLLNSALPQSGRPTY